MAARTLADTGDVARFTDRNRFASWTGTAPIEASCGEIVRHRLSRAGNRRMNHMIHIAATSQLRHDTEGRAYYRRKLAAGKTKAEAMRCLKRRISDALFRRLQADAHASTSATETRAREGTAGRHFNPARPACTRTPALRISHNRDPHPRRYPHHEDAEEDDQDPHPGALTLEGCLCVLYAAMWGRCGPRSRRWSQRSAACRRP